MTLYADVNPHWALSEDELAKLRGERANLHALLETELTETERQEIMRRLSEIAGKIKAAEIEERHAEAQSRRAQAQQARSACQRKPVLQRRQLSADGKTVRVTRYEPVHNSEKAARLNAEAAASRGKTTYAMPTPHFET